jgi:hypothetical protein
MQKPKNSHVTIEDLLHFKRAERPQDSYWEAFDHSWEKAKWKAAITPVGTRLTQQALVIFEDLLPRFYVGMAALLVLGLFLQVNKFTNPTPSSPAGSFACLQGPCKFVCDDLSPNEWAFLSSNTLYGPVSHGTGYTSNALEPSRSLKAQNPSFLF